MTDDRYQKGLELFKQMYPEGIEQIKATLGVASPDLFRITMEHFADIFDRPGLDKKSREIATVAALIVLGKLPQLKFHINVALGVGCTETEIKEIIIQMAAYAGFPAAINAMMTAHEVFESLK